MDAFPSNQPHWCCGHHGLDDGRASALHPQDRKAPAQSDEARAGNDHWNLAPREICRWDKQDEQDGGKCGSDCVRLDEPDSLIGQLPCEDGCYPSRNRRNTGGEKCSSLLEVGERTRQGTQYADDY